MHVKKILDKYKWHKELNESRLQIYYLVRTNGVEGVESTYLDRCTLQKGLFEFRNLEGDIVSIPYHRIQELVYDEEVVWRRWVNEHK